MIPDEEVYQWIEHCNTFFVFGTHHYGEDTGNSACTYKEVKFAQGNGKHIVLLRMIPWATQDFDHLQARVLFKQNMLTLEWQTGTPMPEGLVAEVVKAVKLPSGATGGGATASHAQLAQRRLALEAEREAQAAQAAQSAAVAQQLGEQEQALAAQRVEMEAQAAALAQQAAGLEQQAAAVKIAGQVRF